MKQDHTHKYERRRLGSFKKTGHEVYKCARAGCTHYMIDLNLVVGRYSRCWGFLDNGHECPNEVEMTRYMIFSEKRKRPLCEECKERRKRAKMTPEEIEAQDTRMRAIDRMVAILENKQFTGDDDDAEIYDEQ